MIFNTKDKFSRLESKYFVNAIQEKFINCFLTFGSIKEEAVKITSGMDSSVRFIGSHISVLKPYLNEKLLPETGIVILQDCIRTRNVKNLGNDSFFPKWGSFFPSLGALVPYNKLNNVSDIVFKFFFDSLNCQDKDIFVRVNSSDYDLIEVCKNFIKAENIEIDAMHQEYYKHKIGMKNINGRNFNIAFNDKKTGLLEDVGNVIVLEKDGYPYAVEIAIGASTTLKQIFMLDHILDCHPLVIPNSIESGLQRQLEDCIITSIALLREGLIPSSHKDNRARILKQYIVGLNKIIFILGINKKNLKEAIVLYELLEYGDNTSAPYNLLDFNTNNLLFY